MASKEKTILYLTDFPITSKISEQDIINFLSSFSESILCSRIHGVFNWNFLFFLHNTMIAARQIANENTHNTNRIIFSISQNSIEVSYPYDSLLYFYILSFKLSSTSQAIWRNEVYTGAGLNSICVPLRLTRNDSGFWNVCCSGVLFVS